MCKAPKFVDTAYKFWRFALFLVIASSTVFFGELKGMIKVGKSYTFFHRL
jgi:hypothetical protein